MRPNVITVDIGSRIDVVAAGRGNGSQHGHINIKHKTTTYSRRRRKMRRKRIRKKKRIFLLDPPLRIAYVRGRHSHFTRYYTTYTYTYTTHIERIRGYDMISTKVSKLVGEHSP